MNLQKRIEKLEKHNGAEAFGTLHLMFDDCGSLSIGAGPYAGAYRYKIINGKPEFDANIEKWKYLKKKMAEPSDKQIIIEPPEKINL